MQIPCPARARFRRALFLLEPPSCASLQMLSVSSLSAPDLNSTPLPYQEHVSARGSCSALPLWQDPSPRHSRTIEFRPGREILLASSPARRREISESAGGGWFPSVIKRR